MRMPLRRRALTLTVTFAAILAVVVVATGTDPEVRPQAAEADTEAAASAAPTGAVPPARIEPHGSPDPTWAQAVVGDTLYGIGFTDSEDVGYLETWTDFGWKRVPGVASTAISQAVAFGGALYYLAFQPNSGDGGTALWRYDGQNSPARIATFARFSSLTVADSGVFVEEPGANGTTNLYQYDGSKATPALVLATSLDVTAVDGLGDQMYLWTVDDANQGEVYRVGGGSLALVGKSAYSDGGVEWNGALYFGGGQYSGGKLDIGVYEFDGTTTTKAAVDSDIDFSQANSYPTLGVLGNDLMIIDDSSDVDLTLYSTDGSTTMRAGLITDGNDSPETMVAYDGKLFASMYDSPDDCWLYDPSAVAGTFVQGTTPTVSGTVAVGKTLTAVPGDWTPTAVLAYQWRAGGSRIAGATSSTLALTPALVGKTIDVEVTGTQSAMSSTMLVSAATAAVKPGTITVRTAISGTMKAGSTLKAAVVGLSPTSATLSYRWYRDGAALPGATKSTYKVATGDVGRKLTVHVSAKATGYTTATTASASRTALRK